MNNRTRRPRPRGLALAAVAVLVAAAVQGADAKGFLSFPPSRRMIALENGERPSRNDAGGAMKEFYESHGLCGAPGANADLDAHAETAPQAFLREGTTVDIDVALELHRKGHFEFRLCSLDGSDVLTQDCLNEHVLEFDEKFTRASYSGQMEDPTRWSPADLSPLDDCARHADAPVGSCCNQGGMCSPRENNAHRWVVPEPAAGPVFTMRYKLPQGLTCKHCVLQWFYQTEDGANGFHDYPDAFWDCADISIKPRLAKSEQHLRERKLQTNETDRENKSTKVEGCWSAVGDDHSICRASDCRANLVNEGFCTTTNPYTNSPTETPTAISTYLNSTTPAPSPAAGETPSPSFEDDTTPSPSSPDDGALLPDGDEDDDSKSDVEDNEESNGANGGHSIIPIAAGSAGAVVVFASALLFIRRGKPKEIIMDAVPVPFGSTGGPGGANGAAQASGKRKTLGKLRQALFKSKNATPEVMFVKEVETVVIASPVTDAA